MGTERYGESKVNNFLLFLSARLTERTFQLLLGQHLRSTQVVGVILLAKGFCGELSLTDWFCLTDFVWFFFTFFKRILFWKETHALGETFLNIKRAKVTSTIMGINPPSLLIFASWLLVALGSLEILVLCFRSCTRNGAVEEYSRFLSPVFLRRATEFSYAPKIVHRVT